MRWKRIVFAAPAVLLFGAADLNDDGRVDLVCIATATANLKWYENVGPR